jgi:hypothetical protein
MEKTMASLAAARELAKKWLVDLERFPGAKVIGDSGLYAGVFYGESLLSAYRYELSEIEQYVRNRLRRQAEEVGPFMIYLDGAIGRFGLNVILLYGWAFDPEKNRFLDLKGVKGGSGSGLAKKIIKTIIGLTRNEAKKRLDGEFTFNELFQASHFRPVIEDLLDLIDQDRKTIFPAIGAVPGLAGQRQHAISAANIVYL